MAAVVESSRRRRFVTELKAPAVIQPFLRDVQWGWVWLPLRLYAGWMWLGAGRGKVGSAAWTGSDAGAALTAFVHAAVQKAGGAHPAVQNWYASYLQNLVLPHAAFWSQLVAWGELAVGIGLLVGGFTGLAAFFGGVMNVNYLLSGSTSTNPNLLVIAVVLVLAWRTAGSWGLDRWLLPALGTPWQPGLAFRTESPDAPVASRPAEGTALP